MNLGTTLLWKTCARKLALGAIAGLVAWTSSARMARAQGFTDVTAPSGLQTVRASRANDWWVSGLHFVDLDGDGHLDVFLSSHGSYGALAALGDGAGNFTLVADGYPTTEIHIPYDVDEDGLVDLSTTYQDGGGQWWLNASSPGSVSFSATAVTRETNTSRVQVMLDVNQDGNVDWIRASETEAGVMIDYGDAQGNFAQASTQLPGLGNVNPIPVDIDGDGDKDWVTSWGDYRYEPGQTNVYSDDGALNLVDVTTQIGLYTDTLALQGVGDFDNDGDSDFIAIENTTFPPTIFLNDGTGNFQELADAITGVTGNPNYPTWGLGVVTDLDNDGKADLLFNGRNYLHVLRGLGGGRFQYMNDTWGITNTAEASVDNGFAFGDIDEDGDLDLLGWDEIYPDRYFKLYRNDLPANNWIRVRVVGLAGHRGAPGAKVRVYAAGTDQLLWYEDIGIYCRQVQPSYGYHFAETERHYGLGSLAEVDVSVEFYPSHKLVKQTGIAANNTVRIGEDGEGVIVTPPTGGGGAGAAGGAGNAGQNAGGTAGNASAASDESGCACRVPPKRRAPASSTAWAAALMGLLALRRWRFNSR
jgi:MYXO-CTERM domain-containing protein